MSVTRPEAASLIRSLMDAVRDADVIDACGALGDLSAPLTLEQAEANLNVAIRALWQALAGEILPAEVDPVDAVYGEAQR